MSKSILYIYAGGVEEVLLNKNARDNCSEPYINFKNSIENAGYTFEFSKSKELDEYEWIIFLDISSIGRTEPYRICARRIKNLFSGKPFINIYEEAIKKKLQHKLVLIITEPPTINADNYNTKLHKHFRYVFTWNDILADNKKYIKFYPPVTKIFPEVEQITFEEKKLLVNISANKSSEHPRELYNQRKESILYFEKNHPDDFDLFGVGWNKNKNDILFKSYKGTIENKWDVMPKYKFSLCYENIYDEYGYITEKMFDALRCNTVPVYWGAANVTDYVPESVFIDRRKFKSNEELARHIIEIDEVTYNIYISEAKKFLKSEKFRLFLSDNYVNTILNKLQI
ncbi:MAG: glycosyltransferase family 10 [Bacteroidales bacterium]|nr:glycosyltransferase family 10 [Bacteroidales bacterium]